MRWSALIRLSAWGVFGTALCSAETPVPSLLTLEWAIQEALERNPQIAEARAHWETAVEEIPQARSLEDPGLYTMFWAVPHDTPNPLSAREIWLGAKQIFPYPGKLELKGRLATIAADRAHQQHRAVAEEVVRRVRQAYYDLYLIHKEMEITRLHLGLAREFSRIAETRYATGTESQGDVLKALVEVSDLSNQVLVLSRRQQTAAARLNTLLDREPQGPLGQPAEFTLTPLAQSLEELQRMALENRSELRAAQLTIAQSTAAIELARKDYYPDFMADFAYWNVRDETNRWMLMLEARVPVAFWSRGKHDARVRQAQAERKAWEAAREELENQILYAVEEAYVEVGVAARNADLYRQVILPQARQAVEVMRAGYQTDRESFLSLVDSERALLRFELDYHRARVDYEKSFADLERAVGTDLRPGRGE